MPDVRFSNQYPYTDFHELNLDWVIKEVKYWSTKVGKTIQSIELTGTVGLVDTYTINYSDGTTSTFDVTNGNGIASVAKTGTVGLVDTYTITFDNGDTTTFDITNGAQTVVQTTGSSPDDVMSQKAVTDALDGLRIEQYTQLSPTVAYGKMIPFASATIGTDWTSILSTNANSTYLSTALDVSAYRGGKIKIVIDHYSSTSTRAFGFCNSSNIISVRYVEQGCFTQDGSVYFGIFDVEDDYLFFSCSGASTNIEVYGITNQVEIYGQEYFYTKDQTHELLTGSVYVDTATGSDTNAGTAAAPLKTIQAAVNTMFPHVYVKAGTYNEKVTISERVNLTITLWTMPGNYSSSTPVVPKIVIDGQNTRNIGMDIANSSSIVLSGIHVKNCTEYAYLIGDCKDVEMLDCIASDCIKTGFRMSNVYGNFRNCLAYNITGSGGYPYPDGFNMHGYGCTNFYNCCAHDCGDDGISHHDGCTGLISGGEFYNCGKGGVSSPTHGASVDVEGVYSHDNTHGYYAHNDSAATVTGRLSNSVFKNNSLSDIDLKDAVIVGWNVVYDTKIVSADSTFTEY